MAPNVCGTNYIDWYRLFETLKMFHVASRIGIYMYVKLNGYRGNYCYYKFMPEK